VRDCVCVCLFFQVMPIVVQGEANGNGKGARITADLSANLQSMKVGKQYFDHADRDSDGKMSLGELRDWVRERGMELTEEKLEAMFLEMDSNGDGTVDLKEFRVAMGLPVCEHVVAQWLESIGVLTVLADCLPETIISDEGKAAENLNSVQEVADCLRKSRKPLEELLAETIFSGLQSLRKMHDAVHSAEEENDKFSADAIEGSFGELEVYSEGLDRRVGLPDEHVLKAMHREHCEGAEAEEDFTTSNYNIKTTSKKEWEIVNGVKADEEWKEVIDESGPDTKKSPARKMVPLDFFLKLCGVGQLDDSTTNPSDEILLHVIQTTAVHMAQAKWNDDDYQLLLGACKGSTSLEQIESSIGPGLMEELRAMVDVQLRTWRNQEPKLRKEEIIALRLYTGPMFQKYNGVLRKGKEEGSSQFRGMPFATTLHAINSGLLKLQKVTSIPAGHKVYRGLGGMRLPERFWKPDQYGCKGGVEFGFMSTTENRDVALRYSRGKLPTLLEISVGQVDRGAKIGFLSQYPTEDEILFPPLSNMEVVGKPSLRIFKDGSAPVTVWPIRINSNAMSSTLDQLEKRRITLHMSMFSNIVDETARELRARCEGQGGPGGTKSGVGNGAENAETQKKLRIMNEVMSKCDEKKDSHGKMKPKDYLDARMYKELTIAAVDIKHLAINMFEECVKMEDVQLLEEQLKISHTDLWKFGNKVEVYKLRCGDAANFKFPWDDLLHGKEIVKNMTIPLEEQADFASAAVACECIWESQKETKEEEKRPRDRHFVQRLDVSDDTGQHRGAINTPFVGWTKDLYFGGCKLDKKEGGRAVALLAHVHAKMSESFKLESLDLVGNSLGAQGVGELRNLTILTDLKSLNLSRNCLGDERSVELRHLSSLAVLSGLESLDLSGNDLGNVDLSDVIGGEAAQKQLEKAGISNKTFKPLELVESHLMTSFSTKLKEGLSIDTGKLGEKLIGHAVVKELGCLNGLGKLKRLNLSGNHITLHGVESLSVLGSLPVLEDLDLSRNDIEEEGAAHLGSLKGSKSLTSLNLSTNRLKAKGVRALSNLQGLGLVTLILANNLLTAGDGADALRSLLCLEKLEKLDISKNELRKEGAGKLGQLGGLKMLTSLDLSQNKLKKEGVAALSCLGNLPSIKSLNLSSNLLYDEGLTSLEVLGKAGGLNELDLSDNAIGQAVKELSVLQCISGLTKLNLANNFIMCEGAEQLSGGLDKLAGIRILDLSRNYLGDKGADHALKTLKGFKELEELAVIDNNLSDDQVQKLRSGLLKSCKIWCCEASRANQVREGASSSFARCSACPAQPEPKASTGKRRPSIADS
jgi:hypothetical protein